MSGKIGGPRDPQQGEHLLALYDAFVEATWPVPRQEMDVATSFGNTHVRRSGPETGDPLVLLHPTTGSSASWYRIVAPLAAHHPVFAIDTIGTAGRSVQKRPIEDEDELSTWLDEVLDALGLGQLHLVGFSEGGWLALVHAAKTRSPERLASLVLLEPGGALHSIPPVTLAKLVGRGASIAALPWHRARRLRSFSQWLSPGVELTDREIEWVLAVFGGYRQYLPRPGALPDDELRRVKAPTLLLLGSESVICDPAVVADRAKRVLPLVEVEIVSGAGHGLPFQFPDRTSERLLRFVHGSTER